MSAWITQGEVAAMAEALAAAGSLVSKSEAAAAGARPWYGLITGAWLTTGIALEARLMADTLRDGLKALYRQRDELFAAAYGADDPAAPHEEVLAVVEQARKIAGLVDAPKALQEAADAVNPINVATRTGQKMAEVAQRAAKAAAAAASGLPTLNDVLRMLPWLVGGIAVVAAFPLVSAIAGVGADAVSSTRRKKA